MKKILKIFIIILLFTVFFYNNIYAMNIEDLDGGTPDNLDDINNAGNAIITVCTTVGSIVSVLVLIALGIKYMLGSVEEKATYKKTLLPYFIGAILVFAGSTIVSIIYNIFK